MSRPLRIVMLVTGTFDYAVPLSNALARQGLEVVLGVPANKFGSLGRWVSPAVELVSFPDWPRFRSLRNPFFMRKLARWVLEQRPDVLHLQHIDLWLPLILPRVRSIPVVTTLHDVEHHPGDWQSRKTLPLVRRYQVRRSDLIIVHGESLRRWAIDKYALDPQRVHVRPHGVHELYRQAYDGGFRLPDHEGPTVLFFGRIMPYKGLPLLLEANRLLRAWIPNVRLVIAGSGEDVEALIARYDAEGKNYLVHNRYIPIEHVGAYFEAADVVALPYIEASQSGVAAVAYAFGKPVVATAVGGLPELVLDGRTGRIVPPRDVRALARALAEVLTDPAARQRMQAAIAEQVAGPLNWDRIAQSTIALYEHLCRRHLPALYAYSS